MKLRNFASLAFATSDADGKLEDDLGFAVTDDSSMVELERHFPLAELTPAVLRTEIDTLVANATEYDDLLDSDKWQK